MPLIVEDGYGLADAESYVSAAGFKAYCNSLGYSYAGKTDEQIDQALRRATTWFDARYGIRFRGRRLNTGQALSLPQSGLVDASGYAADVIPAVVKRAVCEAARRELAAPESLSPDVAAGPVEKRIKVEGIEIEYADGSLMTPIVTVVDLMMAGLLGPVSFTSATFLARA